VNFPDKNRMPAPERSMLHNTQVSNDGTITRFWMEVPAEQNNPPPFPASEAYNVRIWELFYPTRLFSPPDRDGRTSGLRLNPPPETRLIFTDHRPRRPPPSPNYLLFIHIAVCPDIEGRFAPTSRRMPGPPPTTPGPLKYSG